MNIFEATFSDFSSEVQRRGGKRAGYAAEVYRTVYKKGNIAQFEETRDYAAPFIELSSDQEVAKFTTTLSDGKRIESVVIPSKGRTTLCVSSQVGCAWRCSFCATGQSGFSRNLSTHEIVEQVFVARFVLNRAIKNVVFMGMGEPFDNFDAVMKAIRVISDQRGFDIPLSNITLSTAGHAKGIARLARLNLPTLRLAVSLHAAQDGLRSRLMPINIQYPLTELKKALQEYPLGKRGVFFIEYILIAGINDSREMAEHLVAFLEGLPSRVNVIPFNPHPSLHYSAPTADGIERFHQWLVERGVFVRVRRSRGTDIMAACGQLTRQRAI